MTYVDTVPTKLMYAVWDADVPRLQSPDLRSALAAAGAEHLQVNVDDEPVAAAMRIPTGPHPIGAVVSVWIESPASPDAVGAVTATVATTGLSVAGWEVEERRPIAPPEVWDGARVDTLANLALLRRPADLTPDEWRHRWLVDHTPVAIATQGTFGYVQNVVVAPVTELPDGFAPVSALVEELFPMAGITDVHAFFGSGGDDAELASRMERLMASVARFGADRDLDLVPTSRYLYGPLSVTTTPSAVAET